MTSSINEAAGSTDAGSIDCSWLLAHPGQQPALREQRIDWARGSITGISDVAASAPAGPRSTRRLLAMPALSNAHDHARTFRSSTLGASGWPLESWLPFMGTVPGLDPYLCAATSFARSAHAGVANLMVHYTRAQGGMPYIDEAREVARAARDVGVRIAFAPSLRDRNGIAYCEDAEVLDALRPGIRSAIAERLSVAPVAPARQIALVDEVATMIESDGYAPHVNVQYGPAAVQWCSDALLEAVARASADTGRGVHMHMLETRYQREWADENHPAGIVKHLDSIGLLSPRLTLAHCVYARPEELALLAERGVTIAVNNSSNLGLKSGIAPLAEMFRLGCKVAMGLDGMALDEDDDALRELRLGYMLNRGWGYETTALTRAGLWQYAAANGSRSVNGTPGDSAAGTLLVGRPADIVVLDWDAVDDEPLFDDVDPFELLLAHASKAHVEALYVGGRAVVAGGRITGIDEEALKSELLAKARYALAADPAHLAWRETVRQFGKDLAPFYRRSWLRGCC